MVDNNNDYKKKLGVTWVRSESGNTYLCPIDALKHIENPTEEHFRNLCVEESVNPQND